MNSLQLIASHLLHGLFYLSAGALAVVCVYTAHNMSADTCVCIKRCFVLIVAGLIGFVMAVFYDWPKWASMLAVIPIVWGITGWLLFDRYRAHEKMWRIYDDIRTSINRFKKRFFGPKDKEVTQ
jgi:ABC-type iron transport system FetAB permease component